MKAMLLCLGLPALALGQLEQARSDLENAEFERAVRGFDQAEASGELDRDALASLYEGRALAHWALGHEDLARHDLLALGALDPERALPPEAPPALRAAFEETVREAIRITTHADRSGSQVTLRAEVELDRAGLVRAWRWSARRAQDALLVSHEPTMQIDAAPTDAVEARVEALGPGGAVIAQAEAVAPAEPAPVEPLARIEPAAAPPPATPPSNDDALFIALGIGGAIALVAGVLAITLALLLPNDATQPSAPVLIGF